ncbi:MAG: MBL fold metallo-hydrolase [Hyphomicrobiaceae bacterium]|nr:MBL fold metallo-hydrolase [Hyphomicrobiaceae bacterium]
MKLTLLGTGTPAPSLKRMSSGYLVEIGDDVIVIDHGPGAHHRLLETGRKAVDVTHCFLTHLHYDHCMDYGRLVLTRWDQGAGKIADLPVYGPPPLARMTSLLFAPDGVYGPDIAARTKHQCSLDIYQARGGIGERAPPRPRVKEVEPGDVIEGKGWKVTVGEGWHFEPYLKCLAYRIDTPDASLCYTGDSGGVCPGIVSLAAGVDVLIHMNHFYTGTEPTAAYRKACGNHLDTAKVAAEAGVGAVVLTHITHQIDHPGLRERIIKEMAAIFSGDIIWGEDLMEIPVRRENMGRID